MDVLLMLARAGARRRRASLAAIALIVALGVGTAVASYEAALRTERAYPIYLRDGNVADLVVNPSFATARAEELIAAIPGVVEHASDDFLIATLDDGKPRPQGVVDSGTVQLRMSANGRYEDHDRPVVHEGRMIRDGREAFLSREAADAFNLSVGDHVPLAFWAPSYIVEVAGPEDVVDPVGRSSARVVGIGVFADEVLVDELYPRQRVLVTPEVAGPFTCTHGTPRADDPREVHDVLSESIPSTCALAYRYYSLQLDGGDARVGSVIEELLIRFNAENDRLPASVQEIDEGYFAIPSATRDERMQLDRSLRPVVTSLRLFALSVGAASVVLTLLLAARGVRSDDDDVRIWRHLGITRAQRLLAVLVPLAGAGLVGLAGAALLGWFGSAMGPVASARALDPEPGRHLLGGTVLTVLGGAALALALGLLAVAVTGSRGSSRPRLIRSALLGKVAFLSSRPSRALGVRAAVAGPGEVTVLAGSVVAVAVVLATLVFNTSMGGLVGDPERYGWPFDAAAMTGYGYGGADVDQIGDALDREEVRAWGIAATGAVVIEGDTVPALAAGPGFDDLPLPLVTGALPRRDHEVALGTQTAADLDLDVGDEVVVASDFGDRPATVTGTVVLPSLGPFESDRSGPGTGVLLSGPLYAALVAEGEASAGLPPGTYQGGDHAFVAIDLHDGVDPAAFLADVEAERGDDLRSWDFSRFVPFTYPDPVRPPQITDVAAMRRVPAALGGSFALGMAGALAAGVATATRARRRELAILRTVGCTGRQLADSVRWHALTVVVVALAVGGPLGIAVGRTLYRSFATDLGVVPTPLVSVPWLAVVVVATVAIGLIAAAGPGRHSARLLASEALRPE